MTLVKVERVIKGQVLECKYNIQIMNTVTLQSEHLGLCARNTIKSSRLACPPVELQSFPHLNPDVPQFIRCMWGLGGGRIPASKQNLPWESCLTIRTQVKSPAPAAATSARTAVIPLSSRIWGGLYFLQCQAQRRGFWLTWPWSLELSFQFPVTSQMEGNYLLSYDLGKLSVVTFLV